MEEKRGSAEGRVNAPLPGLGQRPVSEAHAFEFKDFYSKYFDPKDFDLKDLESKKIAFRFQI